MCDFLDGTFYILGICQHQDAAFSLQRAVSFTWEALMKWPAVYRLRDGGNIRGWDEFMTTWKGAKNIQRPDGWRKDGENRVDMVIKENPVSLPPWN